MTAAVSSFGTPVIESGVVYDVNVRTYSVDVASQNSAKRWMSIPLMSPYLHHAEGEGISVMPEAGSMCWVCQSSEFDDKAFILGFGAAWNEQGSYQSGRRPMNPGDIYLGTRDGNSVFVRRGGVVQIQATPLAQRLYLPINNIIRDMCEAYHLRTFGGDFLWEVDRDETTTTGDRPTRCKIYAKEKADSPFPVAEMVLGHHGDETDDPAISLAVYNGGAQPAQVEVTLGPYPLLLDGKTLIVTRTIEGEEKAEQTITLDGDAEDEEDLSRVLSAALQGESLKYKILDDGKLRLSTPQTGEDTSLKVSRSGTANSLLGFSTSQDKEGEGEGEEAAVQVSMQITKDGSVNWSLEKSWLLEAAGTVRVQAGDNVEIESTDADVTIDASGDVQTTSDGFKVSAKTIHLGDSGSALDASIAGSGLTSLKLAGGGSPVLKGNELLDALQPLLTALSGLTPTTTGAVASAATAAPAALRKALSSKVTTG